MGYCPTCFGIGPALGNFLQHVEVVQNFIQAAIIGEPIQEGSYSLFGFHNVLFWAILHDPCALFHLEPTPV